MEAQPTRNAPAEYMRRPLARRIVGLVGVSLFCEIAYALVTTFALPLYLHNNLHWLEEQVGPVLSAFLLAETVFKPGWAVLSDRIGRKPLILIGALLSAVAVVLMAYASAPAMASLLTGPSVTLNNATAWVFHALHLPFRPPTIPPTHLGFLLLSGLNGVGGAALWPNVFSSVADVTTDKERVGAMSVFNMMYMIGLGGSAPLGSLIARFFPPNRIFAVTAFLFVLAILSAATLVPWFRAPAKQEQQLPEDAVHRIVWPVLLFFAAMSFFQTLGLQLMNGPLVFYLNQDLHLDPKHIGLPFLFLAVIVAAVAVPIGSWGGRWGRVKSVRLGLFFAALGMFMLPMRPTLWWWLLVAVPMILGFLLSIPAWLAILTELAPEAWRGRVYGYVATAQGFGAILGPTIGNWLFGEHGSASPFRLSAAVLGLTLLGAMFGLREGMQAVHERGRRRR